MSISHFVGQCIFPVLGHVGTSGFLRCDRGDEEKHMKHTPDFNSGLFRIFVVSVVYCSISNTVVSGSLILVAVLMDTVVDRSV